MNDTERIEFLKELKKSFRQKYDEALSNAKRLEKAKGDFYLFYKGQVEALGHVLSQIELAI